MILDYVAGSGDNSYMPCMRPYGSLHTVRRRNRPIQISQLSRVRIDVEGAEGSGSTGQGLEAPSDGLGRVSFWFQPRNTSECCPIYDGVAATQPAFKS